jgi:hypothetical protein
MKIRITNVLKLIIVVSTVFCCFAVPCNAVDWNSSSVKQVPETEFLDLLDAFAIQTKANYEKIRTWQGELMIEEDNYVYDDLVKSLNIAEDDPAINSSAIRRRVTNTASFAIDMVKNKLYVESPKPNVVYRALDLDKDVTVDTIYSSAKVIVTPEKYMHYEPAFTYGTLRTSVSYGISGKAAFLDPPEQAKVDWGAQVRDPRNYFGRGQKIWEQLKRIRNIISEHGNPLVAGHPKYKIEKIDIDGRSLYKFTRRLSMSPDDKSKIMQNIRIFDESVGYNMTHFESILIDSNGKTPLSTKDWTYEKIEDVFVPKTVHWKVFNNKQEPWFDSKITLRNSVLNRPIPPETFTIENLGLEDGVRFIDNIRSIEYLYQGGELVPPGAKD